MNVCHNYVFINLGIDDVSISILADSIFIILYMNYWISIIIIIIMITHFITQRQVSATVYSKYENKYWYM